MKISLIIPTYNESKGIVNTLQQFQKVRGTKFEIIVSDNGSSDDTIEQARSLCDKVVPLPHDIRTTIGECRNRGAKAATGDIIWFVDADVRFDDVSNLRHAILDRFSSDSKLVGLTVPLMIYKEDVKFWDKFWFTVTNVITFVQNQILHTGGAPGDCQILKRREFERVGGFNKEMATSEDHDLFHRMIKQGKIKMLWNFTAEMSGRRVHRDGWPKILKLWMKNWINCFVLKKIDRGQWEEKR